MPLVISAAERLRFFPAAAEVDNATQRSKHQ